MSTLPPVPPVPLVPAVVSPAASAPPAPSVSQAFSGWSLKDFDFDLPPELIAQHPAPERSASRLLDGRAAQAVDRSFGALPELLRAGDLLIFNDTRVLKARMFGEKSSGGKVELLVERVLPPDPTQPSRGVQGEVVAHMKVSKKPPVGSVLRMAGGFEATLLGRWPDEHGALFRLRFNGDPYALMQAHGHVPLPPYIAYEGRDSTQDEHRYQTVFARHPGAVAAPTAALHFDQAMLDTLQARGVHRAYVTLHVGAGTFQPVKTENLAEHRMHHEWYNVPPETLVALEQCRQRGGRVVAVGTTCVRTLESWAASGLTCADTNIFITPGFDFQVVDMLVTNFHLPKSTLMMLVSALAGHAHIQHLYAHAIAQRYRFFSYGDAMLLQRCGRV